jgi:hypothetical protein
MHLRAICLALSMSLLIGALCVPAQATPLIEDTFDQTGDKATIVDNDGVGPDWNASIWHGSMAETGGAMRLSCTSELTNGGITSGKSSGTANDVASGNIPVLNATGATYTWRLGNVGVTTAADGGEIAHVFGVNSRTQEDPDNDGILYHNQGGIHIEMRFDDDSTTETPSGTRSVAGRINVITTAKSDNSTADAADDGWMPVGSFTVSGYDGSGWLTAMMFLNEDGFQWEFDLDGGDPAFTWSSTITGAAFDGDSFALTFADYNTYGDTAGGTNMLGPGEFTDGGKLTALVSGSSAGRGWVEYDLVRVEEGNTIPEPGAIALLAVGAVALLRRRK